MGEQRAAFLSRVLPDLPASGKHLDRTIRALREEARDEQDHVTLTPVEGEEPIPGEG